MILSMYSLFYRFGLKNVKFVLKKQQLIWIHVILYFYVDMKKCFLIEDSILMEEMLFFFVKEDFLSF